MKLLEVAIAESKSPEAQIMGYRVTVEEPEGKYGILQGKNDAERPDYLTINSIRFFLHKGKDIHYDLTYNLGGQDFVDNRGELLNDEFVKLMSELVPVVNDEHENPVTDKRVINELKRIATAFCRSSFTNVLRYLTTYFEPEYRSYKEIIDPDDYYDDGKFHFEGVTMTSTNKKSIFGNLGANKSSTEKHKCPRCEKQTAEYKKLANGDSVLTCDACKLRMPLNQY